VIELNRIERVCGWVGGCGVVGVVVFAPVSLVCVCLRACTGTGAVSLAVHVMCYTRSGVLTIILEVTNRRLTWTRIYMYQAKHHDDLPNTPKPSRAQPVLLQVVVGDSMYVLGGGQYSPEEGPMVSSVRPLSSFIKTAACMVCHWFSWFLSLSIPPIHTPIHITSRPTRF
jgi:hypothetical protein